MQFIINIYRFWRHQQCTPSSKYPYRSKVQAPIDRQETSSEPSSLALHKMNYQIIIIRQRKKAMPTTTKRTYLDNNGVVPSAFLAVLPSSASTAAVVVTTVLLSAMTSLSSLSCLRLDRRRGGMGTIAIVRTSPRLFRYLSIFA